MFKALFAVLLLLACGSLARAASYTLTYVATIDYLEDRNNGDMTFPTIYGTIASGDTISIQITYDPDTFTRTSPPGLNGGNYVAYSSSAPVTATIGASSGYNFSGPVGNASEEAMSFIKSPSEDVVYFHGTTGFFMAFYSTSTMFNTEPLENESLEALNAAFMAGINRGEVNGSPVESYGETGIPGLRGRDIVTSYSQPSVLTLAPTAVPEPSVLLGMTGGLLLPARRRRSEMPV